MIYIRKRIIPNKNRKALSIKLRNYTLINSKAIKYERNGDPLSVIKIDDVPVPRLKSGEILVKMLRAPINPSDIGVIEGTYPLSPPHNFIGGEGVGEVIDVDNNVKDIKVGDLVVPKTFGIGTWRTHITEHESHFFSIRDKDLILEDLSCLTINPTTAYLILKEFETLNSGDSLIQNGANSMVGKCIIQIAKQRGIKTINIIRNNENFENNSSLLKSYGADIVESYESLSSRNFKKIISDIPPPKLAINCIGGDSVVDMARYMQEGGTLVTYGAMSRRPLTIPSSLFIFKDMKMKGFWLHQWLKDRTSEDQHTLYNEILKLLKTRTLKLETETVDFKDVHKAIKLSKESRRNKIILKF